MKYHVETVEGMCMQPGNVGMESKDPEVQQRMRRFEVCYSNINGFIS